MSNQRASKVNRIAGLAILIAMVVVLQIIGSFINFGSFSVSLVLVPIVIGAALYGADAGAILGAVFGVVVLLNCINGTDQGGYILWAANPFATAILCLLKGALAGLLAGTVYSTLSKKNAILGAIAAAIVCPLTNTGIFIGAMLVIYKDILVVWAGNNALLYYALMGLAGANFALEMAINVILSPAILRIIKTVKGE